MSETLSSFIRHSRRHPREDGDGNPSSCCTAWMPAYAGMTFTFCTALISAAVTGKIDVRHASPQGTPS